MYTHSKGNAILNKLLRQEAKNATLPALLITFILSSNLFVGFRAAGLNKVAVDWSRKPEGQQNNLNNKMSKVIVKNVFEC